MAGSRQPLGGPVVPDSELKPDGGRAKREGQNLASVIRKELGTSEHLDHVGDFGQIGEGRHGRNSEKMLARELRVHREDPVAASVEIGRHVKRRGRWIGLGPQHRDGPRLAEELREALVVLEKIHPPIGRHRAISSPSRR